MPTPALAPDRSAAVRWLPSVVLGTAATAGAAALFGGGAGLLVAAAALATTLSGELLGLVQARSRALRDELLARLASVRSQHADETVDARSHDPFAHVARMLSEYEPTAEPVTRALRALEERLGHVDGTLTRTRAQRAAWNATGVPELIGGLAGVSESGQGLKRYGDPANLPGWLPGARPRAALLQIGRVLDDIRLLHSEAIERAVLMFTLWARALLLVLAPALGALSFAPAPDLDGNWPRLVPWAVALVWAIATTLAAPRIGALAMEDSVAGLRTRSVLLAVELPLAVTLALTHPGWPAVAFAAGWTNWWQRLGRSPAVPNFSWPRLAAWVAVTAGAQCAGLVLAAGDIVWWAAVLEVAVTLGLIAVMGGSYGAMLPVSVGVAARVLLSGARHRRLAAGDAQRIIDDIAEAMTLAADELTRVADGLPADAAAADVLRRAVDTMRPVASAPARRGPATLGAVVTAALVEGGHDMWVEDPRALAAQARARAEGRTLPVVVQRPEFSSDGLASVVVEEDVADTLHQLLVACIVEARVHGARRVQTLVQPVEGRIEFRIANQPSPEPPRRRGRGRGGQTVAALAAALPGPGELVRSPTNYAFVGRQPAGVLFGVRFSFTVSDTPSDAGDSTRPHM